jgi:hypothetical protein
MPAFHISLVWHRDPKGYRLLAAEAGVPDDVEIDHPVLGHMRTPTTLLERVGGPPRIVRAGGKLVAYEPLSLFPSLYREFCDVTSSRRLLDFVHKFGPLTDQGLQADVGDDVDFVLGHAQAMRDLLTVQSSRRRRELVTAASELVRAKLPMISPTLVIDSNAKRVRLGFVPQSLLGALWLQLGQALGSGASVRACQQCGQLFEAGPGTGRRLDALYCSKAHQIAYNSRKRGKRG